MAWVRAVALVGLLLVLAPMAAVADQPTSSPAITVTSSKTSDGVRYDIAVEPTTADGLWVDPGVEFDVVGVSGLTETKSGERRFYRWDGSSSVAKLTLEYTVTNSHAVSGGPEYTKTDEWVLGPVPALEVTWQQDGDQHTLRPFEQRETGVTIATNGPGVVGKRYAFLGPYDQYQRTANGETIRLVIPRGAETVDEPSRILDTLSESSGSLGIGEPRGSVLLFALPDPARRGGESFLRMRELWVHADSRLDTPNNVWLHEYVHTRQAFTLAPEMQWLREASAEYYGARLAAEQGLVSEREAQQFVTKPGYEDAVLAEPASWDSRAVPYTKGMRTLATLDQRIQTATDGERSLADVLTRLNTYDGTITYEVFEQTVESVAGESVDDWLWEQVYERDPLKPLSTPWVMHQAREAVTPLGLAGIGQTSVLGSLGVATLGLTALGLTRRFYHGRRR
ncbi:hypothetical protein [Haladaptatus sp. DJG-WS-42]|uniref:hypothetical protein n=1 Tax=Haladaptatus sp. DJG-WS-42 TaxID=3120516 RepID=UPI0030CD0453